MVTNQRISRDELMRQSVIKVTALRAHWLKQLLDWPLKDGSLADRLTKAEIAALRKAAKEGKLFHGDSA